MRRRTIWVWILCLALLISSLSSCSFGKPKAGDTDQISAGTPSESTGSDQGEPAGTEENEPQPEPSSPAEAELPEIELPVVQSDPGDQDAATDNGQNNTTAPASSPSKQDAAPEPSSNSAAPESGPGGSDIHIDENGDILLPEAP